MLVSYGGHDDAADVQVRQSLGLSINGFVTCCLFDFEVRLVFSTDVVRVTPRTLQKMEGLQRAENPTQEYPNLIEIKWKQMEANGDEIP